MTALVISDLHLSAKVRDVYRFAVMELVASLIEKHHVNELLVLGDLTEDKDHHPATLVNDIVDVMFSLSQFCELIILRGNHDYTQTDCPFFHFLRRLKRVRWINSVKELELSIGKCLFLPHTRDYKKDWTKLWGNQPKTGDWCFAHNTFEGAVTEHGKKLNGIPLGALPEYTHVISGDIHTPQTLGPVTYVGAPYTVDFGDSYEPRALLLDKRKATSIYLPGPQKRLLELKFGDDVLLKIEDMNDGDIVKVRYTLKPDEHDKWFEIRDKLRRYLTEHGLIAHLVQPVMTAKTKSVTIKRPETKSDERIIQDFGRQLKVPEATLRVGLALLKEA